MSKQVKAVLGILLVFLIGCAAGWTGATIKHLRMADQLLQNPEGIAMLMERRLTGNLSLDSDQKEKIHQLFIENVQSRKALQKEIQPEIQTLNRQTYVALSLLLRPDQQAEFKKNVEKLIQRRHPKDPTAANAFRDSVAPPASATSSATNNP